MEPEEFYDSLDEDSNYGSLDNESWNEEQAVCFNVHKNEEHADTEVVQVESQWNCLEEDKINTHPDMPDTKDDVIPFYEKDLNRSEIEVDKINSKCNSDAECSKNKTNKGIGKRKSNTPIADNEKVKSKSYLNMFHAKIGNEISKNKSSTDSTRANCVDSPPKSFVTCQDFEVKSVYLKNEDFSETESSSDRPFQNVDVDKRDYSSTVTSLESKFCSVSEQYLIMCDTDKAKPKKKYSKSFTNKVPQLGGLGPEIQKDKLDLLKKRQQYGLKASQKNRIKMVEKRLLQNLQREIKECSNINI